MDPRLIIHGGAGRAMRDPSRAPIIREALHAIADEVFEMLESGVSAVDAVEHGCKLLEDNPNFNAGTGSVLQSDGQIRMTAAIMDGERQSFSGVINVSRVQNPIRLARYLQDVADRNLSDLGAVELARELQVEVYDPMTERRLREWIDDRSTKSHAREMAHVVAHSEDRQGTIGVVARDRDGRLCAGTSTGGRGFERIGRVSDTGMPAGNYATKQAAVSATGIGEDIIDECLAAKVVVRVVDGMSLEDAMRKSMDEATKNGRLFGAIAIDAEGNIVSGKTSEILLAAYHDGERVHDLLDLEHEPCVYRHVHAD